jgi:hypothetical protein
MTDTTAPHEQADTAPDETAPEELVQPAAVFHAVLAPLPAFDPDDDERAGHSPEWRRGYTAGWVAGRRMDNLRGDVPFGSQLDQRRLTWALADDAATLYPLGTA